MSNNSDIELNLQQNFGNIVQLDTHGYLKVTLNDLPKMKDLRFIPYVYNRETQYYDRLDYESLKEAVKQEKKALLEQLLAQCKKNGAVFESTLERMMEELDG